MSDRAGMVTMAVSLLILILFIYQAGGSLLLGSVFLALALAAFIAGALGHFRRRSLRIGLSLLEIQAEFRGGRVRTFPRASWEQARLRTRLGDVTVELHRSSGGWDGRVHIYGDAALKVKEWFDNPRQYERASADPRKAPQG
jgi:hypothetical protein